MAKFTIHKISIDIVDAEILVKLNYDIRINDRTNEHEERLNHRVPPTGVQVLETIEQTVNLNSLPVTMQNAVYALFHSTVNHIKDEGQTRKEFWEQKCFGVSIKKPNKKEKKDVKKGTARTGKTRKAKGSGDKTA